MSKNDDVGSKIFGANFSDENREALKKALIQKLSPNGEKPIVEYRLSFDTKALMTQMEDANKALLSQFEIAKKAEKTAVDAERSNAQQLQQEFNGARVAAEAAKKATTELSPIISDLDRKTAAINLTIEKLAGNLSNITNQNNPIATLSKAITEFKTDKIVELTTRLSENTTQVGGLQSAIEGLSTHFQNIKSAKENTNTIKKNLGDIDLAQIERLVGLINQIDKTEKDEISNCLDEIRPLLRLENTKSSNLQSLLEVKSYIKDNPSIIPPNSNEVNEEQKGVKGETNNSLIAKIISPIGNWFNQQSNLTKMAVVAPYILCFLLVLVCFRGVFADKNKHDEAAKNGEEDQPVIHDWQSTNIKTLKELYETYYSKTAPMTSPLSPNAIQELAGFTGIQDNTVSTYCVSNKVKTNICKLLNEVQTSAIFYDYVIKEHCKSAYL